MYAPNSALLNALAHHKINFKQVLKFIESRYDFEPTAFQNGAQKNAANENQGSCKVFCFAHLNNLNRLDTLALFAEHYQAVKDNPDGTDHQNIRQFIHHGWAGIHFEGHALTPKANIDEINAQAAQLYENGGSEFEDIAVADTASQDPVDAQPGATPLVNQASDKLSENTENFAEPSAPKDADGSVDQQSGTTTATHSMTTSSMPSSSTPEPSDIAALEQQTQHAEKLDEARLEQKAEQAIHEAQAVKEHVIIPPSPGSSGSMATETTYYTDNDSVTEHTDHAHPAQTGVDNDMTNTTSSTQSHLESNPQNSPESNNQSNAVNTAAHTNTNSDGNNSATELAQANDQHIADNPAAFIDDSLTSQHSTAATGEPASSENTQTTAPAPTPAATQPAATTSVPTDATNHAGGSGAASASEIVENNASHIANNPAEFIDEKNTSTAADEPATADESSNPTTTAADADKKL